MYILFQDANFKSFNPNIHTGIKKNLLEVTKLILHKT